MFLRFIFDSTWGLHDSIWKEIIIAWLGLAAFLSGWIFVVAKDEFGDEIAWRGGWHERLGEHILRRKGKFYIWLARRWLPP